MLYDIIMSCKFISCLVRVSRPNWSWKTLLHQSSSTQTIYCTWLTAINQFINHVTILWWVAGRFTCFIHLSCKTKTYPYFVESIRYNVFKIYLRDNVIFMYSSYEISVLVFLTICIEQNLYVFNYSKVHYLCRSRIVLFILLHHCVHIALFSHVSAWLQLRSGKVGRGVWH